MFVITNDRTEEAIKDVDQVVTETDVLVAI
jgi:hypothetical protein